MGCWCETCGITQLPINAGDKVRFFVLSKQESWRGDAGGGTCYNNEVWAPQGVGIQGTYDDYGGIENVVENRDTAILVDKLREYWVPFTEKYDKVSDAADMSLSEMLHWIERDKAKIKEYSKETSLGVMFVLEDVYQAMISYNPITAHHNYTARSYRYMRYKDGLIIELKNWYIKMLTIMNVHDKSEMADMLFELSMQMIGDKFFGGRGETGAGLLQYRDVFVSLAKQKILFDDKQVQELVTSVVEMVQFNGAMADARKMWYPQTGKGSQNSELEIYKLINAASVKIIEEREREIEEESILEEPDADGYVSWQREHNLEEDAKVKTNVEEESH